MVHRTDEWGKRACQYGAHERVGSNCTGSIPREVVDKVVQRCLEDRREAEAHHANADSRRQVTYVRGGSPCALCVSV